MLVILVLNFRHEVLMIRSVASDRNLTLSYTIIIIFINSLIEKYTVE